MCDHGTSILMPPTVGLHNSAYQSADEQNDETKAQHASVITTNPQVQQHDDEQLSDLQYHQQLAAMQQMVCIIYAIVTHTHMHFSNNSTC
jgi:hypothetical protein